jgi:predicted DCC family thiol-disulfide oxidoreductase YuxK
MNRSIIFFDGECHLCNRLVQFIIQRSDPVQVASLQWDTAKMLLKQNHAGILALNTLVLFENNTLYIKSDAVLGILRKMHGPWPLLYVFKFIPVSVRDKLYEVFANNGEGGMGKVKIVGLKAAPPGTGRLASEYY